MNQSRFQLTPEQTGIALALLGIFITLLLAVFQAFGISAYITLAVALLTISVIGGGAVSSLDRIRRAYREEEIRQTTRRAHLLAALSDVTGGTDIEYTPGEVVLERPIYGFEEIFAVMGLSTGQARIKPTAFRGDGSRYPLEVHVERNELFLVGFVGNQDLQTLTPIDPGQEDEGQNLLLWTRLTSRAPFLARIPLSRVVEDRSLGDTSDNRRGANTYRLRLTLRQPMDE